DFAPQDLLRARHGDRGHLAAQLLARAVDLLLDLRPRQLELPLALACAFRLTLGDDLVGACVRLVEDRLRLGARLGDDLLRLALRVGELLLAALGGREPVGDARLALLDGPDDERPDEAHREPDEHDHRDRLAEQGEVDVHTVPSPVGSGPGPGRQPPSAFWSWPMNGFAKAK